MVMSRLPGLKYLNQLTGFRPAPSIRKAVRHAGGLFGYFCFKAM